MIIKLNLKIILQIKMIKYIILKALINKIKKKLQNNNN